MEFAENIFLYILWFLF